MTNAQIYFTKVTKKQKYKQLSAKIHAVVAKKKEWDSKKVGSTRIIA